MTDIRENQKALDNLIRKIQETKKPKPIPQVESNLDDNRLIDKMIASKNGDKILGYLNGIGAITVHNRRQIWPSIILQLSGPGRMKHRWTAYFGDQV